VFWEILAWIAVILIYVFRVAVIVGIAAVAILIVRTLLAAREPVRHAGVPARK
jgi:hypothetical protein